MRIIIGADLVPTKSNFDLFINADIKNLISEELFEIWKSSEIRIFNLEVPLVNKLSPIKKFGPNLAAPCNTINGIKALEPTLLTLANNHILDHGISGLQSTLSLLNEKKISYTGISENIERSSEGFVIYGKYKVGVYACTETEFSVATEDQPGANPFDMIKSFEHINNLKAKCDYLIVLYHGGKEHYQYPSPNLRKACKKMVDNGANLVVCQHSHCVGSYEEYSRSLIIYGQGNFIFNKHKNEFWNNGLLIKITLDDGKIDTEYIPIVATRRGIRLANEKEADKILEGFIRRSEEILQEGFVDEKYKEYAKLKIYNYLRYFMGFGKWKSRLDRKILNGYLVKRRINEQYLLALENFIACEAHRELLLKGIKARRNDL